MSSSRASRPERVSSNAWRTTSVKPTRSGERVSDELYARASEQYDDRALATLIMAIGQVCFFLPLALIGKPLPGVSLAEQWRQ
ncbi:hypothetical protein ACFLIM_09650 [Nonomuraea sp. M3C6]|uniref:MFS transporter n=1 Tax=Nonomuraea marmarensis TaxID=3351344 RepID=A0ABW7AB34_9ACTN